MFIIIGAVFDFFDGFAARLLHVSSPVGKELDSLADDITFGFAPSAIVFSMLSLLLKPAQGACCPIGTFLGNPIVCQYLPYVAFIIAAFSALRLAKFNLDERQTTSFIGLPTPANALFWAAASVALFNDGWLTAGNVRLVLILLVGIILSSWLLVAEIPMFALKFKSFALADNKLRYSFILLSAVLLVVLGWIGFSAVIVCYVVISVLNNLFGTKVANKGV